MQLCKRLLLLLMLCIYRLESNCNWNRVARRIYREIYSSHSARSLARSANEKKIKKALCFWCQSNKIQSKRASERTAACLVLSRWGGMVLGYCYGARYNKKEKTVGKQHERMGTIWYFEASDTNGDDPRRQENEITQRTYDEWVRHLTRCCMSTYIRLNIHLFQAQVINTTASFQFSTFKARSGLFTASVHVIMVRCGSVWYGVVITVNQIGNQSKSTLYFWPDKRPCLHRSSLLKGY